jgi:uncharacterized UBP type Zn finger protein
MAHWASSSNTDAFLGRCEHLRSAVQVSPLSQTCRPCRTEELPWLALLLCLTCGWVACSDESPGHHARDHYEETDHPVAAATGPGSTWRWCYVHERAV